MVVCSMRRPFKDSLKVLEADIQHANTLAADFSRDYDGACLQMRMSYSPAAHFFLFLVQWTDCSLAGALGLLRILIYKVYVDGSTTMSTHERKASVREFYAVIFPSLMQLPKGIGDVDDRRQRAVCVERYRRRDEDESKRPVSEIDIEREEECGICMEMNSKVVLPTCSHAMCIKCYRQWAADFSRDYDGACLQMRMSYSPAAHFFLFLVQWTDCSLAGALGLLRILIYKVYVDGSTTMSTHERKASVREFYAVIFPSLMQLPKGISDVDDRRQRAVCVERYRRRDEDESKRPVSEIDIEREEECGICMEMNSKVVLPTCSHAMCIKCYRQWRSRSQSCPFCRDSLKRVNSGDLWMFTDCRDIVDMATVTREDIRRLFMYIEKLPLVTPNNIFYPYDSHHVK